MRRKIGQPRFIDPSLIEIGDDISVEHKPQKGMTMTLRGIVAVRNDYGDTRYLSTREGATLLAWGPKKNVGVRVILYGREEAQEVAMFDLPDNIQEVVERISV